MTKKTSPLITNLVTFCLLAALAAANSLVLPASFCPGSMDGQAAIAQAATTESCCCESGHCCAKKNSDCTASPVDKSAPGNTKLSPTKFVPVSTRPALTGVTQQLLSVGIGRADFSWQTGRAQPLKLYLVHRALLI